jgi:hypothetical protein
VDIDCNRNVEVAPAEDGFILVEVVDVFGVFSIGFDKLVVGSIKVLI